MPKVLGSQYDAQAFISFAALFERAYDRIIPRAADERIVATAAVEVVFDRIPD